MFCVETKCKMRKDYNIKIPKTKLPPVLYSSLLSIGKYQLDNVYKRYLNYF